MGLRTTYTATVSVPVYAAWRCHRCNAVNYSDGIITAKRSATSGTTRHNAEAFERAKSAVNAEWASDVYSIFKDPKLSTSAYRGRIQLSDIKCKKCGKEPKWGYKRIISTIAAIAYFPTFISGMIVLIEGGRSVAAWVIFGICLAAILFWVAAITIHSIMVSTLPDCYTPVFGSNNIELHNLAQKYGKTIPTLSEAIQIVSKFNLPVVSKVSPNKVTTTKYIKTTVPVSINLRGTANEKLFCRKCGAEIPPDSEFCQHCGTKVIR